MDINQQLQLLQNQITQGNLPDDISLREEYTEQVVKNSTFEYEGVAAVVVSVVVWASFGPVAGLGIALIAAQHIVNKLKKGNEQAGWIERGEYHRFDQPAQPIAALPPAQQQQAEQQQVGTPIGSNTQLNAVPVTAATVPVQQPAPQFTTVAAGDYGNPFDASHIPNAPTKAVSDDLPDIAAEIASTEFLLSRIFIGGSRSGKSFLEAMILRALRQRYGNRLRIWKISGVVRANEAWYWDVCDRISDYNLMDITDPDDRESIYLEWASLLQGFTELPASVDEPKLLVIDECSLIAGTAENMDQKIGAMFWTMVKEKAMHLSSAGAASGMAIHLLTPNGVMDSLKMKRHEVSAFNPVFVAHLSAWNETVYQAAKNNGLTPSNLPTAAERQSALSKGCDRIVGINGRWKPLKPYNAPVVVASVGDVKPIEVIPTAALSASLEPSWSDSDDSDIEAIAAKLLTWLRGGGAKHFDEEGIVHPQKVMANFTYKLDGKANRLNNKSLAIAVVRVLENQGHLSVIKGKGLQMTSDDLNDLF